MCASVGGVIAGGALWLVRRQIMRPPGSRLLASAVGSAFGWPLALGTALLQHAQLSSTLTLAMHVVLMPIDACHSAGAVVGAAQSIVAWQLLRERMARILASALGWCLAAALILLWLTR